MHLDDEVKEVLVVVLLAVSAVLLLSLCLTLAFFLRKRRSDWPETSVLPPPHDECSCYNDGFDSLDETNPIRIEERRRARQSVLDSYPPKADLTLKRLDPEIGKALAVEQLMRDSFVFDTRILAKQIGDVEIVAAKRDYL